MLFTVTLYCQSLPLDWQCHDFESDCYSSSSLSQKIEEVFQTYHILFWRSTSLTSKGSCGLQSREIKRKVVTARRGDAT